MTKRSSLWILLCFAVQANANPPGTIITPSLKEKYPYSMLTPDYGIVTEFDLAKDAHKYRMAPYDPETSLQGYWQCVPTKEVSHRYETWRDSDPLGRVDSIITLCFMDTMIKGKDAWHFYHGRRAQPIQFCREYMKKWKQITRNEPIVCFSGEATGAEDKKVKGTVRRIHSWVWNKFRAPKGCHSYFGDCGP